MKALFTKKTITTLQPIWKNIPIGTKFTASIRGAHVSGRIQKEDGDIFLCQDVENGDTAHNTLGFRFSYSIIKGTEKELANEKVIIKTLTLDPKFKAPIVIEVGGRRVVFNKGSIKIGCTTVTNAKVKEIYNNLK